MNRLKKKMLLIISDDYSRNWSPEHPQEDPGPVCAERLRPRSRHARDAPGRHLPPLHRPPLEFKFMSTTEMCCQHILTIKRTMAGEWIVYMCRYWLFNMFFKGRIFPASEERWNQKCRNQKLRRKKEWLYWHDLSYFLWYKLEHFYSWIKHLKPIQNTEAFLLHKWQF